MKRHLFVILILMLLALLLLFMEAGYEWRDRLESELREEQWEQGARQALGLMSALHTVESQIEVMGLQMTRTLRGICSRTTSLPPGAVVAVFRKNFPRHLRAGKPRIYAFSRSAGGSFATIAGPGLTTTKGRVMAEVFQALFSSQEEGFASEVLQKRAQRLLRGTFGEDTSPALFVPERSGRTTPVVFEGRRSLLYWHFFRTNGTVAGGFLLLFPRSEALKEEACRYAVRLAVLSTGGAFQPYLHPFPQAARAQPIPMDAVASPPVLFPFWKACQQTAIRETSLPVGKPVKTAEFWGMKGFFSFDVPLQAWVFSRPGSAPAATLQSRSAASPPPDLTRTIFRVARIGLALFGVLLVALAPRSPPFVSLRVSFGFILLLIGALPLFLLFFFGKTSLEIQTHRSINQAGKEAMKRIRDVDLNSAMVVKEFSRLGNALTGTQVWRDSLRKDGGSLAPLPPAQAAISFFASATIPLDLVQVFQPGEHLFYFPEKNRKGESNRDRVSFFAPIVKQAHELFHPGETGKGPPRLADRDQSWEAALNSFGLDDTRNFFLNFLDAAEMFRLSGGEARLYLSHVVSRLGKVLAYVILEARADKPLRNQLKEDLTFLNLSGDSEFVAGETIAGGMEPFFPSANSAIWQSKTGAFLKTIMGRAARTQAEALVHQGDSLYLAFPCQKAGAYVIGTRVPLGSILHRRATDVSRLRWFVGIMALLLFAGGFIIMKSLIQPLALVEQGLRRVAGGDLSGLLGLSRKDELGAMTQAFDEMIVGLRERRAIGKFVSGGLEANLSHQTATSRQPLAGVLQPQETDGTILISDIRAFTTLSERHSPTEIVGMLNRHLEVLAPEIEAAGGKVDTFIGDAIVAFFSGESPHRNAENALKAALAMRAAHRRLQDERRAAQQFSYEIGIGMDCGKIMFGRLGSQGRRDFALVGACRHQAEAMEALSKTGRSTRIVLSPAVAALIGPPHILETLGEGQGLEVIDSEVGEP